MIGLKVRICVEV